MKSGIKLTDLVKTVSGVEKLTGGVENYVPDKEAPKELGLSQKPKVGERKVIKTWKLEVVFDLHQGIARNVAVLGRMNYRRDKVAESVAKDQEVKYSNPVFYRNPTDSLKQVELNARDMMVAGEDYDTRVMYLDEQKWSGG